MSPENESLSPYFDSLTPVSNELYPEEKDDLSTKFYNSGYTGDKSGCIVGSADAKSGNRNVSISNQCLD
jgi:hypothetical protein